MTGMGLISVRRSPLLGLAITIIIAVTIAITSTASSASALVAPDLSMDTIPVAYFGGKGGKSGPRSQASIAMLASALHATTD